MAVRPGYIGEIDGLRCFAMTGVVAAHANVLSFGWAGVWLFFVISGFVVTKTLCERVPTDKRPNMIFRNFMIRRVLRIWPIYFLYIFVGILATTLFGEHVDYASIGTLSTFTYNFYLIVVGHSPQIWPTSHLWTISVEEQFYLIFGLLFAYLSRRSLIKLLWLTALAGVLVRIAVSIYCIYYLGQPTEDGPLFAIYGNFFCQSDAFCMGALIALNADAVLVNRGKVYGMFWGGVTAFFCYREAYYFGITKSFFGLEWADIIDHQWREVFRYSAIDVMSVGLICMILINDRIVRTISGGAVFRWIGKISYGAYIYHPVAMLAAHQILTLCGFVDQNTMLAHMLLFVIAYPLVLAVADFSFRYFESMLLRYRRLF
jgi:peptidoglycan/LPS O-acetylase OafA/YrhL